MKNVLKVNYNNQVTVRLSGVAELLGTNESNLRDNLSNNKDKFIEGKDYYKLSHKEVKSLNVDNIDPEQVIDYKGNQGIQLWTQSGLAMHAKLVLTGYAWDIQRKLVDNFFGHKEEQPKIPQSFSEALLLAAEIQAEKELLQSKNTQLQIALDLNDTFASVGKMKIDYPYQDFEGLADTMIGKVMTSFSRANGFEIVTVPGNRYPVNTYESKAWERRFGVPVKSQV